MKVLELFAGTRSIGKAFEARGHQVYSVEWDKSFDRIDLYADIGQLTAQDILEKFGQPDVIWASPDCTTYSVAAISTHRQKEADGNLRPMTEYAEFCDKVNAHVVELIKELNPRCWFIENPPGTRSHIASTASAGKSPQTYGPITRPRNLKHPASVGHRVTTLHRGELKPAHRRLKTPWKRRKFQRSYASIS